MDTLSLTKETRIYNRLKTISFTSGWPVFPAPLVKEIVFSPLYNLVSFIKDKVSIGAWIYLWAFSFVPLIYISVCVPAILSWWLWPCSRAWSQAGWFLHFHSSFSRLLWLFEVFFVFPYKLWNYLKNHTTFVNHQKIHSKEKPHKCNECGIAFRNNSVLLS